MRTVLHVGMPRTGTKWLQTEVFPKHPGIEFHRLYDWPKLVGLSQHPVPAGKVRVISCEHWTDWRGGGWKKIEREVAMLCDLFGPETRILMVVRDPDELMESVFRHCVEHGAALGRRAFMWRFERDHTGWEIWGNHIEAWRQHFSDVHWVPFESLYNHPKGFLNTLSNILHVSPFNGIDHTPRNTSLHQPWLTVMQAVNCITGTYDMAGGRHPMGRLRRAITAANARM